MNTASDVSVDKALEAAERFDAELNLRSAASAYAQHTYDASDADRPTLQIDDVSGIPFLTGVIGIEYYQLRAFVRAREGDAVVATVPAIPAYERYNDEVLGFGRATMVEAPALGPPIRVSHAASQPEPLAQLAQLASDAGGMTVHPYMGIEAVWDLAAAIADKAGVRVSVLAPPPPICWFANDKEHLTDIARATLGDESVVATHASADIDQMARSLAELADSHDRVALKLTRCASAMGNLVLEGNRLRHLDHAGIRRIVAGFLDQKQWTAGTRVISVAWESNDVSPSIQIWIPLPEDGPPVVDGVYEQLLEGDEKVFLGSVVSRLPAASEEQIIRYGLTVATAYQALGYVGRCSFDFIDAGDGDIRFVECNGRWGGTSTPMHLVDRAFPGGRPSYRAQDVLDPRLVGRDVGELLDAIGDRLYHPADDTGTFIVYNVGCLSPYGKFDVVARGETSEDARQAIDEELHEILNRAF